MQAPRFRGFRRLAQAGQPTQISDEQLKKMMEEQQAAQGAQATSGRQPGGPGAPRSLPAAQGNPGMFLLEHGALVEVLLSAPPAAADAMRAAGQDPPPPQKIILMVDTGASITGVRDSVATAAGLVATSSVEVGGVAGTQTSAIYAAKIELPAHNVSMDAVQIAGFQLPGQMEIDGLMGRDMLEKLVLLYDGPAGSFKFQSGAPETVSPISTIAAGGLALLAFGSLFWLAK